MLSRHFFLNQCIVAIAAGLILVFKAVLASQTTLLLSLIYPMSLSMFILVKIGTYRYIYGVTLEVFLTEWDTNEISCSSHFCGCL